MRMSKEPANIRAIAFFDRQNLFHCAKQAFGYTFPNFDPAKLAAHICAEKGWQLNGVRFYTGVPDVADKPFWNHFWTAKGAQMGRDGVYVFTRPLVYRNKRISLPDGNEYTFLDGNEKGIDVRISLDVIRLALKREFDVAILFCRDQNYFSGAESLDKNGVCVSCQSCI